MKDLKVYRGDAVKATEDGKFSTLLVRFSDPDDRDLYGDFFTSDTFFGESIRSDGRVDVYYDHGFSSVVKRAPIGTASMRFDEVGAWMEGQIEISDEHFERYGGEAKAKAVEAAIRTLAVKGKLGSSSGSVGHLVDFVEVGDGYWIKSWPIAEGSLTPRPADPKKRKVETLKSFSETPTDDDLASIVKAAVGGEPTTIHIHNHAPAAQEKAGNMEDKTPAPEPTKSAPAPDIDAVVSARVEAALKARDDEREADAKAFADEEARAEVMAQKKFDDMVKARNVVTPFALRTNGIQEDNFANAFKSFLATEGDASVMKGADGIQITKGGFKISLNAVQEMRAAKGLPLIGSPEYRAAVKASNATDMNIGTAADGGNTVPTGFYNQIISRRDEMALHGQLGCQNVPGVGTSVEVSVDNEADGEFIVTSEAAQYDEDAPAIGQKTLTLVKYTKRTLISEELLADTGINILDHVQKRVAIGWAKTINNLLVTEAVTGTQYKRLAGASSFAAGEIEDIVFNSSLSPYADDEAGPLAFVTRSPTYGLIAKITGSDRLYGNVHVGPTQAGVTSPRSLLEYPVFFSNKVDAPAARAKSLLFGNWDYMLYREGPALEFLVDPYTRADYGQTRLLWKMRWDFELAIDEAVGYAEHSLT